MPELPEITAIAQYVAEKAVGTTVRRVDVAALSVLKTFSPGPHELVGATVTGTDRIGKYFVLWTEKEGARVALVVHLSRAGWLRWSEKLAPTPLKPGGKSPIALRVHVGPEGEGFDLTEAGTQKRLAVWIVHDPSEIEMVATLGPDALTVSRAEFGAILAGSRAQLKNLLRDQRTIAGIGNAYSDEILHTAKLSPFAGAKSLDEAQTDALYAAMHTELDDAVARSVGQHVATLKAEKRSGMKVHGRTGSPCPVCGDTVREVSFADRSFQYCPTCQTGGKILADRRLSKLLK
ncbi:DNA-formamidopyrimidine glycosylase OS=Tsukamurella paurometabola (strain ATCC 8368 / DSM /CCUG 35730 / CIP 100753 / JCM 10117 / KCTC 9821 / NBRC 16120/ NCIMB 702349 / NCTC 13040) OX=521096 GN=Tpau_3349 PE=3 SV=1 [Tsukamurella paurometabola]|uniref:DNA-formamidopyrimidine glycosylase n=1 Tax=Tsukamurella paurometabola (strain ATCC 8368 / DSM 20162 / CCUG 35730 / CIP 100753 / JCM 10117 / KCTC 9821 / NBRC 16120 / NCIMB 702349 / NCTC 13040) TaxID=521096 RepID=D5UWD4_TSUPD|nr:DNA-formamidopyrimidine glycosylase family protein [Tsukamurella paurometabola]ADG79933.1 DNA-formamidopyrimidine glycosylase [Tsukamurella paurometabola DSM 20162]SUP37713.1 Formamidopyrimidine-DNA glycosylase [Tsukamurella paurometabola]